ncbi:MAG: hypothetical protein ACRDC6_11545 [Shewanella sp.]
MDDNKNQELIIVNAISQMVIPTEIFEKSEFKQAINDFKSAQESVQKSLDSVEYKRKAVDAGSSLGNWWNNRNSELRDAQLDLNKSMGLLTKQSSDLILFNTAISKVLVSQQKVLHEQQELLKKQASELASQNTRILKQQKDQSEQQKKLLEVNKGLLEAKGITKEHAEKLVGCVRRVEIAEHKMEISNQELERSILARIIACEGHAESIKEEVDVTLCSYGQDAAVRFEEFSIECNSALESLRGQLSNFELKINSESEVTKQVVTSVVEEFNQRIDELKNELVAIDKKLSSELVAAKENFVSKIELLSLSFDKRNAETKQRIDELQSEQEVSDKKLRFELGAVKEYFVSQIELLSLNFDKRDTETKQLIDELQNEQEVSDKKLRFELGAAKEYFVSQIESLSLSLDKRDAEFSGKNKMLFYFTVAAMIVSAISLIASVYLYLSA